MRGGETRNEEVGDLGAALLAAVRELILDGPVQQGLVHCHQRPSSPETRHSAARCRAGGRVAGLEICPGASGDQSALQEWRESRRYRRIVEAGER